MKPSPPSRPFLPAALLAFTATAFMGWKLATRPLDSASQPSSSPAATASLPARRLTGKRQPSADAQTAMALIRQSRDPGERIQGTIALANSISASNFATWFKAGWFNVHEGPELTVFTKIVMQRWKKEDPDGYLDWVLSSKSPEASAELSAMMAGSPEKALEALKKHPDTAVEGQALIELARTHPEMAADALRDFAVRNPTEDAARRFRDLFREMAGKDPAALEALIPSFAASYRDQMTAVLWGERLKASFSENLQRLWELPDGAKIFINSVDSSDKIDAKFIEQLGQMPADWIGSIGQSFYKLVGSQNAEAWLQADLAGKGFARHQIDNIREAAIESLSLNQPEKALKFLDGPDISDEQRKGSYYQIFANCRDDPEKQKALIAGIESEAGKAAAAETLKRIADQLANQQAAGTEAETKEPLTPDNILGRLADAKSGTSSAYDYIQQMSSWDEAQVRAAASQFSTLPDDQQAAVSKALLTTIRSYSGGSSPSELKNQAILYAINHPDGMTKQASTRRDEGIESIVSSYVMGWSNEAPDAASSWVTTLPDGDAKSWAMKNLARNWNRYDPEAVDQWIGKLPAAQQDEVRKYITPSK